MNKSAFTLVELLIVVAIIATLVGVAMPYYQNYVKETRIAKAKHELDIIKEALIKFNTFEDRKFTGTDLTVLLGKYMQNLSADPWGRTYEVDATKGQIKSLGPDHLDPRDDITVDFMPPLALQKATWIDSDNNQHITASDVIKLEFSKILKANEGPLTYGMNPNAAVDLVFSQEVQLGFLIATSTPSSSTEVLIPFSVGINDTAFYPGSSTIRVASANVHLQDDAARKANGTGGEYPGLEVTIKSN